MKAFKEKRKIEDVGDYIGEANDIFDSFLQTFTKENKLIRDVTEDDFWEEGIDFIYTAKGTRLADKMRRLLIKVGEAHFPNEDIEIESNYYIEY